MPPVSIRRFVHVGDSPFLLVAQPSAVQRARAAGEVLVVSEDPGGRPRIYSVSEHAARLFLEADRLARRTASMEEGGYLAHPRGVGAAASQPAVPPPWPGPQ